MRNQFAGPCYRCGHVVKPGDGHFEKVAGTRNQWRTQHASCAIKYRGTKVEWKPPTWHDSANGTMILSGADGS